MVPISFSKDYRDMIFKLPQQMNRLVLGHVKAVRIHASILKHLEVVGTVLSMIGSQYGRSAI